MTYLAHSALYIALFAAGVTCGILYERYRISHQRRVGRIRG